MLDNLAGNNLQQGTNVSLCPDIYSHIAFYALHHVS